MCFYLLYGHWSLKSLSWCQRGHSIGKVALIARVGNDSENGIWASHLHFQLMLYMLGNVHYFPGVAVPAEILCWKSICPDPFLLFKDVDVQSKNESNLVELKAYRQEHLGKSLSLSYDKPLKIVRGSGAFLIDPLGQKYLDTVNNVAHVGHEHPRVVNAGRKQMAVLNTNTLYLHERINQFAAKLLTSFPE